MLLLLGGTGMVGSAIKRAYPHELVAPTRQELNLLDQQAVHAYIRDLKPTQILIAAAKVGGIHANATYPADFLYENLVIATNAIHAAHEADVNRLLFLGSTCIYPKMAPQPIPESALLTGPLEPTNEAYAIAKIAGVKLCEFYRQQYGRDYISAMPTNLYGPGDNYHPENSHVLPALLQRISQATDQVTIWGTGKPLREFLYVDDLAEACLFLLENYHGGETINVGSGEEVSIRALAELIAEIVGFEGELLFDPSKPDGTPRKICDTTKINQLGWQAKTSLREGITKTLELREHVPLTHSSAL